MPRRSPLPPLPLHWLMPPTAGCPLPSLPQVLVYGPPARPSSEWQQVADLSTQLLAHLEQSGWRELAPPGEPAPGAGEAAGCLRLRGGGSGKRKRSSAAGAAAEEAPIFFLDAAFELRVGDVVEVRGWWGKPRGPFAACRLSRSFARIPFSSQIALRAAPGNAGLQAMSAEEGLYGCWFAARVQRLAGGWALVQYDELREGEEEGSPQLCEWFPVPGQRQAAGGPLAGERGAGADGGGGHTVHSQWQVHQLRPPPPADVGFACSRGGCLALDLVPACSMLRLHCARLA